MRGLMLPGRRMPRVCKYSWTSPADNLRPRVHGSRQNAMPRPGADAGAGTYAMRGDREPPDRCQWRAGPVVMALGSPGQEVLRVLRASRLLSAAGPGPWRR